MEQGLRILGDGVSIAALSIIASISWNAWKRIAPEARVPVQFNRQGEPSWRASREVALVLLPIVATAFIFLPTITGVVHAVQTTEEAVIMFAMRALMAGALAMLHLLNLSRAMKVLGDEGKLRS